MTSNQTGIEAVRTVPNNSAAAIAEQLNSNIALCDIAHDLIANCYRQQAGFRRANIDETVIDSLKQVLQQLLELATLIKEQTDAAVLYDNPATQAALNEVFSYVTQVDFIERISTNKTFCGKHQQALEIFNELLSREIAVLKAEAALAKLKATRLQARDKLQAKKRETALYAVLKRNGTISDEALTAQLSEFQAGRHHPVDHITADSIRIGNLGMSVHFSPKDAQQAFDIFEMPIIPPLQP
ncbi:hypothetical protein KBI23_05780 [bacterium]|nr:hypothetical protein [bacterium]MBP9810451.1 hypothetical protein [bacterium]